MRKELIIKIIYISFFVVVSHIIVVITLELRIICYNIVYSFAFTFALIHKFLFFCCVVFIFRNVVDKLVKSAYCL